MSESPPDSQPVRLERRIGVGLLSLYGLGTILGAGIYVLVGKVALQAGMLAPVAFIVAAAVAWVTALSYAQLSALFPKAAGEVIYVEKAFGYPLLARVVGLLIVLMGIVSAATLTTGFIGYLQQWVAIDSVTAMVGTVLLLTALASWGVAQSLRVLAIVTLFEIGGLVLVIVVGFDALADVPAKAHAFFVPAHWADWQGILLGAFLAFYAFVGFEDMVNLAEEVKTPHRTMPLAIIVAILGSGVLYILVALVALTSLPLESIQHSDAPLADVLAVHNAQAAQWISLISIFAILNGVLVQLIMVSRVLYGMAARGFLPAAIGQVSAHTHTPVLATCVAGLLIMLFALALPLLALAQITSLIVLLVFCTVNLALWRLSQRPEIRQALHLPHFPRIGLLLCVALLFAQIPGFFA